MMELDTSEDILLGSSGQPLRTGRTHGLSAMTQACSLGKFHCMVEGLLPLHREARP